MCLSPAMADASAVLQFWFDERCRKFWFKREDFFDAEIRERFAGLVDEAAAGRLASWESCSEGALGLVILLDQFPRNLYRDSPRAYGADALARGVAARAIDRGFDRQSAWERRFFFYMPFEHSESAADQDRAVELFGALVEASPPQKRAEAGEAYEYARRHQEIIRRFGRFPHRNAILGRVSTPAESAFLQEPRSSF
jgi:uncharacterized protein (DUF924 family)